MKKTRPGERNGRERGNEREKETSKCVRELTHLANK
jgi:hypothetical protein